LQQITYVILDEMKHIGFIYNLHLSQMVKEFYKLVRFDKVIAISWWSTFLGHNVHKWL